MASQTSRDRTSNSELCGSGFATKLPSSSTELHPNRQTIPRISSNKSTIRKKLNIFFANTKSIVNKLNELKSYVFKKDIDICVLNETWLSDKVPDQIILENHIIFRKDRTNQRFLFELILKSIKMKYLFVLFQRITDKNFDHISD